MTEIAQTKTITPVTFDNLVLKQWLYNVGSVRRYELLRKLKTDLQDLGLSKRLVRRGLIQLATKPRVVLARKVTARQYGSRRLFVDENEDKSNKVTVSYKTDIEVGESQLQPALELVHESVTMDTVLEEKYKQNEKVDGTKSYQTITKRCSPIKANIQPTLQSFDKALEQLNMINSAKRNVIDKLISKKTAESPDTSMKTQDRVHNRKSPSNRESMCNKAKNLDMYIQKNVAKCTSKKSICSKSNEALLNKTLTQNKKNTTKEDLNSNANKTDTDVKTDYKSNKVKHFTQKNVGSTVTSNIVLQKDSTSHTDIKIGSASKYCQKRKLCDAISEDFVEKKKVIFSENDVSESIERRKRKILIKFRKYFGNCVSVSEDEQEETILYMNCKKRKKKDSCDSGVCSSDGSITANFEEKSKQARSVPDLRIQEEFNEDENKKNLAEADNKINVPHEEDNRNETVTSGNETESTTTDIIKSGSNNSEAGIAKANTQFDMDKTATTENAKGTLHRIETSVADNSSIDTQMRMSPEVCYTFETEHREYNILNLPTTDYSDIQEDNLDSDFNELLQMTFDSTCQIKSNGNVLSIQENLTKDVNQNTVKDKDDDENSNLETFTERKLVIKEDEDDDDVPLRDTVISINPRVTIKTETELVNDTACHILDNVSETQKSQLEVTVKEEKIKSNQSSQVRLRVLSSAELGSRWCPTPINTVISGTDVSSHNFSIATKPLPTSVSVSQAVSTASKNLSEPITITPASLSTTISLSQTMPTTYTSTFTTLESRSVPVPVSATKTVVPLTNATESNLDSESVNTSLVTICNLIKTKRSSPLTSVSAYDSVLYSEFDKLRKRLRPVNFPTLLHGIIKLINKKEFEKAPVALHEIFCYTPSLRYLYTGTSSNQCNVNDLSYDICYPSETATTKVSVQKKRDLTSPQISFQESVTRNTMPQQRPQHFNQASINQENLQNLQTFVDKTILQSPNVPQNDTSISNVNLPQSLQPSTVRKQKSSAQLKTSHTVNQKLVSNRNISQGIPRQQQVPNPSANAKQTEQYMFLPTLNGYVDHPYVAHNVDVPGMKTFYGGATTTNYITQNINPVSTIQQQNVNLPRSMQPPNVIINSKHAFQSQNINSVNQQFPKSISQSYPKYNVAHRPLQMHEAQLSSQNTPIVNYPPTKFVGPCSQQPILNNTQWNEQMYQKVQMQPPLQPQNFAIPTTIRENQELRSKDRTTITRKTPQVSLVSTAKDFNILKLLSPTNRVKLLKQINFYFGCTTWLEQEFTQTKWQKIQFERTTLLNFHTLLKHLVDKALHNFLQNKYQAMSEKSSTTCNANIDVPKEPQITVERSGAHWKVDVSYRTTVQGNVTACAPQENLNVVQNQSERGPEVADRTENTKSIDETQKSENTVCDQKDEQKTVRKNNYPRPASSLETEIVLKDTEHSESEIKRNSQDSTEKQHTNDSVKVLENSSNLVEDQPLNLVESNKDKPLLLNSHSVTVLISPDSDHVTVLDIVNAHEVTEDVFKTMDTEIIKDDESSQNEEINSSVENSTLEMITEPASNNSDTNSESSQDIVIIEEGETCSTRIADVRSISLKSFEEMGLENSTTTAVEENIVEEEMKVCLCCSKLSTVVCSLCLEAKYCSKECSELYWPEHYKICKPV
ncbi:uncharacterized protein LOC144474294 [Augochlora pura]